MMMRHANCLMRLGTLGAIATAGAAAAETITYNYDAHGRLVQVQRAGSVNNGVTTYSFDRAHNRTARQTTGAP